MGRNKFSIRKRCCQKFDKNKLTIAINILYAKKEKNICSYLSKHTSNRKKPVVILMIPNGEGWHYLVAKKLSTLLRGITLKNNGDLYCLNCLNLLRTKNKHESHKRVCENKGF